MKIKLVVLATTLSALAACGEGADKLVFDEALGPLTKAQVEELPNDLRGTQEGILRSGEIRGANLEEESPGDGGR